MLTDLFSFDDLSWTVIVLAVCYLVFELYLTQTSASKSFPLAGLGNISKFLPLSVLNLVFAFNAITLVEAGYRKVKDQVFQIIRNNGSAIVSPVDTLEELAALPQTIADSYGALSNDLLGRYTGLDVFLRTRMHHAVVRRKLTPALDRLTPMLEQELVSVIEDNFPACELWTKIRPWQLLSDVSARLSARALVGPDLCRNTKWLAISINYTETLFTTVIVLRFLPNWMHWLVVRLLPSYWKSRALLRQAREVLVPSIEHLLQKQSTKETWEQGDNELNALTWLADAAKGEDRDSAVIAHIEVLLALASVHTTLLRMVSVLYDLIANPSLFDELRAEIDEARDRGWTASSYASLPKLDSVLRESQRMSPPSTLGMKRLIKQPYTFANGIYIPANSYVCLPTFAIEHDPEVIPNPSDFDGLRSYRLRQQPGQERLHQFISTDRTALNFGHGKFACPGRFFAERLLEIVFVKLLSEYDFRFLPGKRRPRNLMISEFLFPWP